MLKNPQRMEKFEKELMRREKPDPVKNFKIIKALYDEAVAAGALPLKNPLEGIEVDIRIARVINNVSKTP